MRVKKHDTESIAAGKEIVPMEIKAVACLLAKLGLAVLSVCRLDEAKLRIAFSNCY